ncbi:hypothetical protein JTB14_032368 [Gonioctena quinquepunctata]|nr:hypothetical protein JTB14_032368 [Gonioctena quinquepunctata]
MGEISAVKWLDSKFVFVLSNHFPPKDTTTMNRKKEDGSREKVFRPRVVADYNRIMGGVDRFDQLHERYAIGRRATKWWHRIFHYVIDMTMDNTYIDVCEVEKPKLINPPSVSI